METVTKEKLIGVMVNCVPKWPLARYSGAGHYYYHYPKSDQDGKNRVRQFRPRPLRSRYYGLRLSGIPALIIVAVQGSGDIIICLAGRDITVRVYCSCDRKLPVTFVYGPPLVVPR